MLGSDVVAAAPDNVELFAFDRSEIDIVDASRVHAILDALRPAFVINAAAFTKVDEAESHRDEAFAVNSTAVGTLGLSAARIGARVLHFSTDYVFDGDTSKPYAEEALPRPLSVYGASKLAGEQALKGTGVDALIIRTQWLYSHHGLSFPLLMWKRACSRLPTRVVRDQVGRPTYTANLAPAAWALLLRGITGTLHLTNGGAPVSRFDVALEVFRFAGVPELLQPCASYEFPTPAIRPTYSALDTTAAERALGGGLPDWRIALRRVLEQLRVAETGAVS